MEKKRADPGYLTHRVAEPKAHDFVVTELSHDSKIAFSARGFRAPTEKEKQAQ